MGGTVNFERLRRLEIDGQLGFGRLHDRQVGGLGALKDFAGAMAMSNRQGAASVEGCLPHAPNVWWL